MSIPPDPRIFFAAERTLLAWLRTGIAVIGLGFVVARFGLFLRLISQQQADHPPDNFSMSTVVQSCRIEEENAALLSRQAKRRHLEVSTLTSLYLKEKTREEEFPGIGFRDSVGGRGAYVLGHRVTVWEVVDVNRQAKGVARTAEHFRWLLLQISLLAVNNRAIRQRDADRRGVRTRVRRLTQCGAEIEQRPLARILGACNFPVRAVD